MEGEEFRIHYIYRYMIGIYIVHQMKNIHSFILSSKRRGELPLSLHCCKDRNEIDM